MSRPRSPGAGPPARARLSWARIAATLLLAAAPAAAQTGAVVPLGQVRTVDGRVVRAGPGGTAAPLARQYVVLHRVGQDRAGPLDSVRTDAGGTYHFTYTTSGEPDAVYFASTRYAGIAYFTAPLQAPNVSGPGAALTVFDTTSTGLTLHLAGRHVVIGAPGADGVRTVAEVFDLGNAGGKTLVTRDSLTPLWSTPLPAGAVSPAVDGGDVAPGAVTFDAHEIRVFAPVSPGVRQLSVTFGLPAGAFPLRLPMPADAAALELLLEEPTATPTLDGLKQQASVSAQGRTFKRYFAQNVPAGAVLRVDVASVSDGGRARFVAVVALAMAALMVGALVFALRRRRPPAAPASPRVTAPAPVAPVEPVLVGATPVEQLRFALARLDAAFARRGPVDDAGAARHRADRAALEARIADALAREPRAP